MTDDGQAAVKIVRESEPINLEYSFSTLDSLITSNDAFYVRNHFSEPQIDIGAWRLSVEGRIANPFKISYEELIALPSQTVASILECAGNSRVFLTPKVKGAQWGLGAVGNAEWTGVPLRTILKRAGVADNAVDVVFEGADQGIPDEPPKPVNPIHYTRSVPVDVAASSEILVAYTMNGMPLSQSHGFPVRLIVPGWYGMASVKWLKRIVVTDFPFDGYFQKIDYAFWQDQQGLKVRVPITEIEVKSQIARPAPHEVVPVNKEVTVTGAAWAGTQKIAKVEISTNGGKDWLPATLTPSDSAYTWSHWTYSWITPDKPQTCILMSRATDVRGCSQPLERDAARDTYRISHVIPIPVQVR